MASLAKKARRAMKRVTLPWRRAVIEQSPPWVRRTFGPTAKYVDMLLVDHGVFRALYSNRHRIGEKAWRAAQPAPRDVRKFAALGIRTIINLRGPQQGGSYWLEQAACLKHGIRLVDFQVRSRAAPTREEFRAAQRLFAEVEYPILMHCKSGADRAGLMSVLYCHYVDGIPIAEAKRHLSLRFGHIRQADTGILDHVFEQYVADNARDAMPFSVWVDTVYDPVTVTASFRAKTWANGLVNAILRRE